jgi:DNA-binding CsgD family transcriptional regulator/tetratricopeptide (TPR) repeat protein
MAIANTALVGRVEETERLRACAARARSGRRVALVVAGEAGIGKSRLVSEAVSRFRKPDDLVLVGHCVDLSSGELPYGMVSDCLRGLVREVGVEAVRARASDALPVLGALCPALEGGATVVDRGEVLGAFVSLVERLAEERLIWLVVEDLHWSDSSSRELLDYLVRVTGPCRLAVLITTRTFDAPTAAVSSFVSELIRVPDVDRVTLGPLSSAEVAEQVRALADETASPLLVERVATLSQGVPFLVEQLIAAGIDDTGPVPASAWEPMMDRVTRLDPATHRVIQLASLADGHLTHSWLERVHRQVETDDVDQFNGAVNAAVRNRVLRFDPSRHAYEFAHALLRQAVDSSVVPIDRLRWHRAWATVLGQACEQAADPQLQVATAHHWALAGADVEAFDSALAAAAQCSRLGAMAETAALLRRALELWDRVPAPATRAGRTRDSVLFEALNALVMADDPTGVALIDAELSRADADDVPLRTLCLQLERYLMSGDLGPGEDMRLWRRALASLDTLMAAEPNPFVVVALVALGVRSASEPDRAMEVTQRAVDLAARLGDLRLHEMATVQLTHQLAYQGRFDDAVETCNRLSDAHPGRDAELLELEQARVMWLMYAGRYHESIVASERLREQLGDPRFAPGTWQFATWILTEGLLALGQWDEAQDLMDVWAASPPAWHDRIVYVAKHVGAVACQRGDLPTARQWLEAARWPSAADEASAWFPGRTVYRHLQARVALADGEPEAAREVLAPLWGRVEAPRVPDIFDHLILAAQVETKLAELRDHAPDAAAARAIEAIRGTADDTPRLTQLAQALATHLEAELAHATAQDSAVMWADVVERWRLVGHVPYLAQSLVRLAAGYLQAQDRESGAAALVEALHIASRLRAEQLRSQIVELAHGHRVQVAGAAPGQGLRGEGRLSALTPRELEVLRLVAQGMSDVEIGNSLFISRKTVSVHVSHILAKLNVNSRIKATAIAYEDGVLQVQ